MNDKPATLSRRTTLYVRGIILLGAAILAYAVVDLVRRPIPSEWFILVGLTVVSGWATLRSPTGQMSFSISDMFTIAAALVFGPSAGAITAALDGLVLSYRMANIRRSAVRVLFNVANLAIATWIATQVFSFLAGNRPVLEGTGWAARLAGLLAIFGVLAFGLNSGIVALAVSLEQRRPFVAVWREHFLGLWVSYFGGVFGAMLLMVLTRMSTFDVIILIAPLPVLLYLTFKHALGRAQDQISHLGSLNKVYVAAIEALAHAIDAKDQVTHDHIRRVQDQSVRLARALRVEDEAEIEAIKAASLLHDVGKLAVPEHILNKPGKLTASEYDIMKRHAPIGADILSVIGFPYPVVPIVRHHHENWDGSGYPDGLSGERIPIGARILSVVDCFDALTSDRPYRPRLEDRDALQIILDRRGSMYDPHVVDTFFHLQGAESELTERTEPVATVFVPSAVAASEPPAPVECVDANELLLASFYDLGCALAAPAPMSIVGATLWTHLGPHLPASAFVLFEYDSGSDALVAAYETGDAMPGLHGTRVRVGERLSGWVAATGQTILNSDARLDLDETRREDSPLRSALAVPVTQDGRVSAVFSFYSVEANAFNDTHRRVVLAAAHAVAARTSDRRHVTV